MTNNSFHFHDGPSLPIVEHIKNVYKRWIQIQRNMPKCERFGLGQKVDFLFIDLLNSSQKASFSPLDKKVSLLENALSDIDSLRFFIQFCWELKLIPNKEFAQIGEEIENIGKMAGGWRKGIISKTPH